MLKVAVLGGGGHSRGNHLPALARFRNLYPGRIELSAFCDLNPQTATEVAREYGFARHYTDLSAMLVAGQIDACIAVTPVHVTASVAAMILPTGIPLLMEKPPGATPAEVDEVCARVEALRGRVMVSMNRRFDPALTAARSWLASRSLEFIRASMLRDGRTEPAFVTETAIHAMDAVRHLAGEVRHHAVRTRRVDGTLWYWIELGFESGASGVLEIMPTCGCQAESYDLFSVDGRATARIAEFDVGTVTIWDRGRVVREDDPTAGLPGYVRNGTYAETEAFLSAVEHGGDLFPTPKDVRPSVTLCHAIRHEAGATPGPADMRTN